jgi:predicted Fe-Mo cluster-binding NifX family protein
MKIALPSRNGMIDGHFGHCEYFTIFSVMDGKISEEKRLDPPEGCGCKSNVVSILAQMGVTVMLAGNMGEGAVQVLGSQGIQVLRGCSGDPKKATEAWLTGNIRDSGEACTEHEGCH